MADYQALPQEDNARDTELPLPISARRHRLSTGPIDLSKLDNAFKKWTENIAQRMKTIGKKKKDDPFVKREIIRSVFDPPVSYPGFVMEQKTLDHSAPMTEEDFRKLTDGVKTAILQGHHPKMITKGSSGSYFARARMSGRYQTVGVFKPKDEEPYGRLNPKTTKWLHRKLRWIIPFGRACLIPNLSYVSEAAASLLDTRLGLHIVPKTELVSLSSQNFFYDWIDRTAAKKGKPLPEKVGSMQFFMHGFTDASEFLRRHPLPDRSIADTYDDSTHRSANVSKRFLSAIKVVCGSTGDDAADDGYDPDDDDDQGMYDDSDPQDSSDGFHWTPLYLQEFREELEKLVILDYLMRNTDRGSDNYMVKTCDGNHEKKLVDVAPSKLHQPHMPAMSELKHQRSDSPYFPPSPSPAPGNGSSYTSHAHVHLAAIDNSLSFPHEHPKGWRSYTYGWLYLPVSVIGRPFSDQTRKHILPLLTSKEWWEETTLLLRKLFAVDPGFHPSMFRRQLAVMKGQAWNIVQCLRHSDEGPLELTRRKKMLVWDDEIEVDDLSSTIESFTGPPTTSPIVPRDSLSRGPTMARVRRSLSIGNRDDFPPPMRRASTDVSGIPRPVSFATKFPRINPGASGVAVLEHMERLDAVEAGLKRLGEDLMIEEEDEDGDIGKSTTASVLPPSPSAPPLMTNSEILERDDDMDEADIVGQSSENLIGSLPNLDQATGHLRSFSSRDRFNVREVEEPRTPVRSEWLQMDSEHFAKRLVIVERLEPVKERAFFSCW